MSFADDLLPVVDAALAIPGELGLNDQSVTLYVRTWSGARVGLGTATTTTTPLLVGGRNPDVEELSLREVVASGGKYQAGDIRVSSLVQEFPGGGTPNASISPTITPGVPTEVYFLLGGPNLPSGGVYCQKIGQSVLDPFTISIVLRATSFKP